MTSKQDVSLWAIPAIAKKELLVFPQEDRGGGPANFRQMSY